ncbi:alanine--tRNA ligase [Bartonella sp. DGB1]|uniref:alanine--tRNA ligase n=1 Tax=Bartonella sp. DGB1 TaxID=3239807 RepID=UPI003523C7BC
MNSVNKIRSVFLDYFAKVGHVKVDSASLITHDDPSLMFTNAGMVPFKNFFTGVETPKDKRVTSAQKCVRAGGKHNDLDNVGYTARHHTFFEMLGNFSFGDYFKEEAIFHSWNLLTKEFALPKEKLLVTVYHTDEESINYWKKIANLSEDKIIRISTKDNFWTMGETGPCGPCSEIFYDHGDKIWGGPPGSADEDGDRFVEIWNLVFMQFEQTARGEMLLLPKPSIDTGMGLERIAAVLQGVHDNYDIDLFKKLIDASVTFSNKAAKGDSLISHRVIADHLRSASFLIAEGILPSNEGRGYILRRIMRRAMRHINLLGVQDSMMWRLVPTLIKEMGDFYPELANNESLISETLLLEEDRFRRTLDRGLLLLDEATKHMKSGDELQGDIAFKLYDTYGFPLDLTQDVLRKRNIKVDVKSFEVAMEKQKQDARSNWSGSGEQAIDSIWFKLQEQLGETEFLGYSGLHCHSEIKNIICADKLVDKIIEGQEAIIISDKTCFYPESGGQIGDKGLINGDDFSFEVLTTKKHAGIISHYGIVRSGIINKSMKADFIVDKDFRKKTAINHSATHLLHAALRKILGNNVMQKGSLVSADRLRFDFSYPKPLTKQELIDISNLVNQQIFLNNNVNTSVMDKEKAIDKGAVALFGEKYSDLVRVVTVSGNKFDSDDNICFSTELCGGTHVENTAEIGLFHIISDSGVSAGVRRIEALTSEKAREYLLQQEDYAEKAASLLKTQPEKLTERLVSLLEDKKKLERDLTKLRKESLLSSNDTNNGKNDNIEEIANIKFLSKILSGVSVKELKALVDAAKIRIKSGIVAFIAVDETNKATIIVGVTADLLDKFTAVSLVKLAAEILGGKGGGGRPDMAQAGGSNGSNALNAIEAIKEVILDKQK